MNRRPSFADRIRQIREVRHFEEADKASKATQEAEAAKAAVLARLDKIVDNSSDKNRNFFIAYLGLLIYVQAIILSTSDLKLLLPNQELKLPLIDLGVPLVGFYFTIPIFVIALHFNFLQNLESHHYKLMRWQQAHPNGTVPRSRLNPFLFDFAILEQNSGFRNWVLWANNILCYNLAPITLALLLFRYADRQDFPVTLWHYAAFVVDSYLVWRFRKALLNNKKPDISEHNRSLPPGNVNAVELSRHSGMDRRNPDCRDAINPCHPWSLGSGDPCRNDEGIPNSTALPECVGILTAERVVNMTTKEGNEKPTLTHAVKEKVSVHSPLGARVSRPLKWQPRWPRSRSERLQEKWGRRFARMLWDGTVILFFLAVSAELALSYLIAGTDDDTFNRHVLSWAKPWSRMNSRLVEWVLPRIRIEPTETVWQVDDKALKIESELAGESSWVKYFNEKGEGFRPDPTSLRLVNLSGQKMPRAQLSEFSLQGADLKIAQMQGADLSYAQMQGVMLSSTSVQGALLTGEIPVYGNNSTALFYNRVTDWAEIEKLTDVMPRLSDRQTYLDRIKQAQQPEQINQAQQHLIYTPTAIANSALSAICNLKNEINGIQPKETRLASAQAFRNSYINIRHDSKQNPDYPKILLDIDYQLCTLDECKDLRDGIEGLDCQKASQNPPKW